jgi:ribosomal protein S18 acetylase RimI-like enzyme
MTYNLVMDEFVIRNANESDLPSLGRLGAVLLRTHHDFDQQRFMAPGDNPAEGYAWFLGSQLTDKEVVVLVAERLGTVVGYVYAGLEPQSWKELREASGFIHDVVVDESSRGKGIAESLVKEAIEWLRAHGAPRVVLWTAERNAAAQHLFSRIGFRRTMQEMTLELAKDEQKSREADSF